MEANEDRSASAIPKYLVYATMFFVILRIVLFGLESHIPIHHSSKTATKAITWLDLNNYISERSKTNPKNLEVKENQEFIVEEVKKTLEENEIPLISYKSMEYRVRLEIEYLGKRSKIDFVYDGTPKWTHATEVGGTSSSHEVIELLQKLLN